MLNTHMYIYTYVHTYIQGGIRDVGVIVEENGHGDTRSNPGQGYLQFA